MGGQVTINWKTAEYLAVLVGQVNWGDSKRRASACANLCEGMGTGKMETSLECFDLKEDGNSPTKAAAAEKSMILKFLRSQPGTEELVAGIESGKHYPKKK